MQLPLQCHRLFLDGRNVEHEPSGELLAAVASRLQKPGGVVLLGSFGSGKTMLCETLSHDPKLNAIPVPLRVVARASTIEQGLRQAVGVSRLEEARAGDRVLLLDGLDEVVDPGPGGYPQFFYDLIEQVGPRWLLTSRPGHFRTGDRAAPDQIDSLACEEAVTLAIRPLTRSQVREVLGGVRGGKQLIESVEGLEELATAPLLLHAVHAALPFIDPGRPIQPWGVFDAWLRFDLSTGRGHDEALGRLEDMAWENFRAHGFSIEQTSFDPALVDRTRVPAALRSALLVTDLDGQVRFGHRSVYEFLLSSYIAPRILQNQGHGPDPLSGLRITSATRAFSVGRVGTMKVVVEPTRTRIPRGNFIAGGDLTPDERPLRIAHLPDPVWIAREPVTNQDWVRFLADHPDDRIDANYLRHWGADRSCPPHLEKAPVYHVWPEDADAYAASNGARLPIGDEWEKAVRGLDGRRWPWGDYWKKGVAVTADTHVDRPLPTRAFGAHGDASLFSAVGGVFEYTADKYGDRDNRGRVVMGGCYTHPPATSRASLRLSHKLSGNLKAGLRLAWDVE